jgi:hypothetical protein
MRNFFTEPINADGEDGDEVFSAPEIRSRTDEAFLPYPNYRSYWWDTSQVPKPAEPALVPNIARGANRFMSDWVIPGYRERSAAGEVFNNPLLKTVDRLEVLNESGCAFQITTGGITYNGDIQGVALSIRPTSSTALRTAVVYATDTTLGLNPDRSALIASVSTEARGRIAPSAFDGLVSLGELNETLRYLRNPFEAGLKLASKLERKIGRPASSGEMAMDFASTYLGFRYGMRPLVRDVENALKALQDNVNPRPVRETFRAKGKVFVDGTKITLGANYGGITYDETLWGRRDIAVRCGFLTSNTYSNGLQDRWGMRLSDIPAAMWELIPLSFMVDWVLNVRQLIAALSPRLGLSVLAEWTTVTDRRIVLLSGSNYRFSNWTTTRSTTNEILMEYTIKQRTPSVNPPMIVWKGLGSLSNDVGRLFDTIGIFGQKLNNIAQAEARFASRSDLLSRQSEMAREIAKRRFQKNWWLPQ